MISAQLEIQLIAVVVAVACALPGVFLILRRMAMMSDAISHAILFGIVLAFFIVHDLASPLLILGAALTGVLTVAMVEGLNRTRLVREDAAIGLVFPLLFSAAVILISRYAGDVHLDTDAVLLGELAFAPFDRLYIGDTDIGPRALYVMGGILLLNVLLIALFYKELKLTAFDTGLAAALGFSPALIHYGLMTQVSLTAVGAFDAVGSILVVALMVGPPATAYLLTDRLSRMLLLSAAFGAGNALAGYWIAHALDVNIAGSIAAFTGVSFTVTYLAAPGRGLIAVMRRRTEQRRHFAQAMLTVHILNHQGSPEEQAECHLDAVYTHMNWDRDHAVRVIRRSRQAGLVTVREDRVLELTPSGREMARKVMER